MCDDVFVSKHNKNKITICKPYYAVRTKNNE